jgi:L-ribulokinase
MNEAYLGLDFGTLSVRAVAVSPDGDVLAGAVAPYEHGQIVAGNEQGFFDRPLPPSWALQHPIDWLDAADEAVRSVAEELSATHEICGIGVDFTSCTVLPTRSDGTPLAVDPACAGDPHGWPKLWKHHGARDQAKRLTEVAVERGERWLSRYGGVVGLEWFFPKVLEVVEAAPDIEREADVWLEAGDWLVWQLTGSVAEGGDRRADGLTRSTCQAGSKACWSPDDGDPSAAYLAACHPDLARVAAEKMPGTHRPPGTRAGTMGDAMAARWGVRAGTPVSVATIDAHAGVPGAGVGGPGDLVLVLGTSGCHMVMAADEHQIPGVAGVVRDGILPGYYGYETGQAALGDAFEWVRALTGASAHDELTAAAAEVDAGADGLVVVDWFNGCRTPLMDGELTGAVLGLDLHHGPGHLYRAALEAGACGVRWIVDTLREGGVDITNVVATGGLSQANPLLLEIVAAVLDRPLVVPAVEHGPAVGSAIFGALAADRFDSPSDAVAHMAGEKGHTPPPAIVAADPARAGIYADLYHRYRAAANDLGPHLARCAPDGTEARSPA